MNIQLCMTAHCMAINKTVFEEADAMQYVDAENHTWTTDDFFKAMDAVYAHTGQTVGAVYCSGQGGDQEQEPIHQQPLRWNIHRQRSHKIYSRFR